VDEAAIAKLRSGVSIAADRRGSRMVRTAPAGIRLLRDAPNPWYEVTLIEGRNRQIRQMFEAVGHLVEKIKRVRYGPLELDLEPGHVRPLTPREVQQLYAAARGRNVPASREKRRGTRRSARDTK
jgi:23S rRNA pseudouridine2605 synthase